MVGQPLPLPFVGSAGGGGGDGSVGHTESPLLVDLGKLPVEAAQPLCRGLCGGHRLVMGLRLCEVVVRVDLVWRLVELGEHGAARRVALLPPSHLPVRAFPPSEDVLRRSCH